jgi:hypothetical protein
VITTLFIGWVCFYETQGSGILGGIGAIQRYFVGYLDELRFDMGYLSIPTNDNVH